MTIGIGEILVIVVIILLLFGNLPKITRNTIESIKKIKKEINK